ncbi:MAG: HAAS signaling domain-containing protein [Clostridia bacterium]
MTSGEYLKQLEKYLRKLPQSDYEDAMEYFTEYLQMPVRKMSRP